MPYVVPDTVNRTCTCQLKHQDHVHYYNELLFGLEIECDHVFQSKWLVNELFKAGFSISYSEVDRFKKSVVANQSVRNSFTNVCPKLFTQFVRDYVDHNIRTLDGSWTCHGMGIIAVSTPFPGNSVLKEVIKY